MQNVRRILLFKTRATHRVHQVLRRRADANFVHRNLPFRYQLRRGVRQRRGGGFPSTSRSGCAFSSLSYSIYIHVYISVFKSLPFAIVSFFAGSASSRALFFRFFYMTHTQNPGGAKNTITTNTRAKQTRTWQKNPTTRSRASPRFAVTRT